MTHARVALTLAASALALPAAAGAATLNASPSSFGSVFASAQNGDTILLASGNYGTWAGGNKVVTIKADAGASPAMKVDFDTGDGGFTLDGLSGMSGGIANGAHDITIRNSSFSDTMQMSGLQNANVVFDHDKFNNIGCDAGCLPRLWLPGQMQQPSGVTVQNSQFIGGSSDGIQAGTALSILNNEFANIVHGGCNSCHTDNIQLYGGQAGNGVGTTIKGNYIHDGETGIVQFDGGGRNDVEDNVIAHMSLFGMDFGGDDSSTIVHNTEFAISGQGLDMTSKAGQNSVNATIRDNVLKAIALLDSDSNATPKVNANNMLLSGASGQNFNGTPSFQGGANPTTYAGFALAAGSPGKGRASDGLDVGIRVGGSPPPPGPDTTPPDTTITAGPANPSTSTSASLEFTSSESGSTFACKLDAGAFGSCTSPTAYSGLSTGSHTFSVRAADAAGNVDLSPATWTWTISATPPPPPPTDHQPGAAYAYTPRAPRVGRAVAFDASRTTCADAPCTYAWADDGPDGPAGTQWALGNGRTMSFTFRGAGRKWVRLTVTDADGDKASTMKAVTVAR
jgi:hypothetical protein